MESGENSVEKLNNKKLGNKFEKDFVSWLANKDYWVHFIKENNAGAQPFDILALKEDCAEIYECKTLTDKNGLFPVKRIEMNQRLAFQKVRNCKNIKTPFSLAILWNNNVYLVSFDNINFMNKSINLKEINPFIRRFYENNN